MLLDLLATLADVIELVAQVRRKHRLRHGLDVGSERLVIALAGAADNVVARGCNRKGKARATMIPTARRR